MARKSARTRVRRAAGELARPARETDAQPRRAAADEDTPYHHGALRDALLQAAERVLERDGLAGLTLRAVAREAGVSHAAPTHHFGDLTGLVSELAAIGFRQFNAAMVAAGAHRRLAAGEGDGAGQGLCRLCAGASRHVRADVPHRASRYDAAVAARGRRGLVRGPCRRDRRQPSGTDPEDALSLEQAAAIARAWSLVHGFTMLLLDGRLTDILRRLPKGTDAEAAGRHAAVDASVRPPGPCNCSAGTALGSAIDGAAALADHLHLVLAAFENRGANSVGGLARRARWRSGLACDVDIGDMAATATAAAAASPPADGFSATGRAISCPGRRMSVDGASAE